MHLKSLGSDSRKLESDSRNIRKRNKNILHLVFILLLKNT